MNKAFDVRHFGECFGKSIYALSREFIYFVDPSKLPIVKFHTTFGDFVVIRQKDFESWYGDIDE